ncbi:MAG: putative membrane protein YfcA [Candidatus Thalassarchaeaceae archaeon]|jgi:uncharacterized membrane protein YfcA|tara:strand:+ start:4025 stop:4768 length:744 start_codon:yes stop_codon:yes gene_type:complete
MLHYGVDTIVIAFFGAFFAAALTVPAGFGLSTVLTPVVLLMMGPHEAIAVVAVVHGAHNAGKYISLRDHVDYSAIRHYGFWLVVGSILGALLQNNVPQKPLLLTIGIFLVILPLASISESWTRYRIPEANDKIGGFGSGFMGGISGHQGALRAMFLTRRLNDKMKFAATASVLALCVDVSRIPVYLFFRHDDIIIHLKLTIILVIAALLGIQLGKKWLHSMKNSYVHNLVMAGIIVSGIFYIFKALS